MISKIKLPLLKNAKNLKGKRVLLRLDLNVPMEGTRILDNTRIKKVLPTLLYLRKAGARTIVISHLGKDGTHSLKEAARILGKHIPLGFMPKVSGRDVEERVAGMKNGSILVLENLRREKGETKNSNLFALSLSRLGDVYVNDAFSESHRKYASIVSLPKFLPSYAGLLFEKEIKELSGLVAPKKPFLFILGGAKISTKLPLIKRYLKIADWVFVGGAIMNSFFKERGFEIGKSLEDGASADIGALLKNKKLSKNLILPTDVLVNGGKVRMAEAINKKDIVRDIGPASLEKLKELISGSKEILFNGPLGNYELGFDGTTKETLKAMIKTKARTIVGGGDTQVVVSRLKLENKLSFVSSGGGAMIEFLAKGTLPGIEALKKFKK
ncbi:MAG: phosphoglycerate kinase [Patescibacteria group bacterium]